MNCSKKSGKILVRTGERIPKKKLVSRVGSWKSKFSKNPESKPAPSIREAITFLSSQKMKFLEQKKPPY
jgi:hypothetical protein